MSNRTKAEKLADRPYVTVTALDVPTVGNPYYFAYSPEVRHCFGTGNKPDDARAVAEALASVAGELNTASVGKARRVVSRVIGA